jgi:hypothetical protein
MQSRRIVYLTLALLSLIIACGAGFATEEGDMPSARDPELVAQVKSGQRTEANAAWWGFNANDSTECLQAAIDSGARRIVVPYMGAEWIVRP